MGGRGCTWETNCIRLLLNGSSCVRHQKCNKERGTEEGLYPAAEKNDGNFSAKNHDLTLGLHKELQPNVHPTILMRLTRTQNKLLKKLSQNHI